MEHIYDVAVIGGGIAGYSAALSSKSLGLDCLWLGADLFGEKVKKSEYVRNYPSFLGNGADFFNALEAQREREGVLFTEGRVDGVFRMKEGYAVSVSPKMYSARTVILCTGVDLKGKIKGESEFLGRGVSYCAVCDGPLFRGKKIAAVLGDPRFCEEAEYLAGFAKTLYVFAPFAGNYLAENIVVCGGVPRAVEGEGRVQRLLADSGAYDVDGVFLLRSAVPPEAIAGGLKTDGAHIVVDRSLATSLGGLFAAGDVTGPPYQYAKAAGEGLVAAHSAKRYLGGNA